MTLTNSTRMGVKDRIIYEECMRQKEKRFRNHIIENLKEGVDYLDDIQRNKNKNKT